MDALFPPGPQKRLLLGNAVEFRHDPLAAMVDATKNYGEIVHFRFGPSHAYLITNADFIHYVLVERPDLFDARQRFYRAIQSALGHELFAPGDGVYKRRKPTTTLPLGWLESQCAAFTDAAAELCASWRDSDSVDVDQALHEQTLPIAARAVFGDNSSDVVRQLADGVPSSATLQDRRFTSPWKLRLPHSDRAQELVIRLVRERRFKPTRTSDGLSRLAELSLPEREVAAELIRLFFALHEIAATTLSWTLYLLAQNPDQQVELQNELATILAGKAPTADDLPQLAYTEKVLQETMRLYPPAWLVCRQTRRETRIGSFYLPAGSTVLCSPYLMQRSPRNFVEPQKFLPERFGVGYEKRMRRYAFAPFGGDASLEYQTLLTGMKLLLASISSRFSFEYDGDQPVAFDPLLTLRPKGGVRLRARAAASAGTSTICDARSVIPLNAS